MNVFKKGFTIVELLIVVVVIAILATITIVSFNSISTRAHDAATVSALNQIIKAIEMNKSIETIYPQMPNDNPSSVGNCIGTPTDENPYCTISTVAGSDCSALGYATGTTNVEFNMGFMEILSEHANTSHIGAIQSRPNIVTMSHATDDCAITQAMTSPTYDTATVIRVRIYEDSGLIYSINRTSSGESSNRRNAIDITYYTDAPNCTLSGSFGAVNDAIVIGDWTISSKLTACHYFAGNVIYEYI